jgi:hypothetical protein
MLIAGHGGPKDEVEARRLHGLAAAQRHAGAQCGLAGMLISGHGGPKDETEAWRLLGLAFAQGHAGAQALVALMHNAAHGRPKLEAEAQRPRVTKARKGASENATAQIEDAAALAAAAARADAAMAALLAEEESEAEKARSKKAKAKKKAGAPTEASANANVEHASAEANAKARAAARAVAEAKAAQAEAEEQARNQEEQEAKAVVTKAAKEAAAVEEPPDHFICPITQDVMIDPVSAADGHIYERCAITEWLVGHSTSPMTGAGLKMKDLFPNHTVRGLIRTWQEAQRYRPAGPAARQ